MTPIRILLVDDHPPLRAGIRARLEQEPDLVVVGETGSGAEALRLVEAQAPHVVVLDMQISDLSGAEVARRLQAAEAPVRVLALSAYDDSQYILKLLDSGASGYLSKHEPLETIVAAVRGVARGETGWLSRGPASVLMQHRRLRLGDDPVSLLSAREKEVLRLLAAGLSNQQIGEQLFIAESTVKKHVNSIYGKLELNSRAEAVAWAWKQGLGPAEA